MVHVNLYLTLDQWGYSGISCAAFSLKIFLAYTKDQNKKIKNERPQITTDTELIA